MCDIGGVMERKQLKTRKLSLIDPGNEVVKIDEPWQRIIPKMAHPDPSQISIEPVQTDEESLSTGAETRLEPPRTLTSGGITTIPVTMATHHPGTSLQRQDPSSIVNEEQTELTVSQPCRTHKDSVYDVIESVIQQATTSSGCASDSAASALIPSVQSTVQSKKSQYTDVGQGVCSKGISAEDEEATDGVYVCPICSRECSAPKYLKLHLTKHENDRQRPLDCDMCGKTFSTHQSMKLHRYTHTGEKPYVCQICHKHFRQAGTLKRHMVTHTGEQPHRCPHCPRHFSQRSSLTAHLRLHTEQSSFLCTQCGKSFKTERYMKRHMIYHTDRLPFSCELCDRRFRTRLNMRRHMLRIHLLATRKVCKCLTCGAEMQNPGALKNHMAVHNSGRKPYRAYVCEICSRRFQQRSKLKKHKQDKHGGGDSELDNQPGLQPQVRADQVCRMMTRTTGQQRVTTYEMIPKDLDQFAHIVFPVNGRPSKDLSAEGRRKSATNVPSTLPQVTESNTCNTEHTVAVGPETVSSTTVTCEHPLRQGDVRTDSSANLVVPSSVSVGYSASTVGGFYTNATISNTLLPSCSPSVTSSCLAADVPSAVMDSFGAAGRLTEVNSFVPTGLSAAMSAPITRSTLNTTSVMSTPAFAASSFSLPSDTLGSSSQSVLSAVSTRESVSETLAALRALAAQEGDIFPPVDFGVGQYVVERQQTSHEVGNAGTSSGTVCGAQQATGRHTQQSVEASVNAAIGIVDTLQQAGGAESGPNTPGTRIRVESQNQALLSRVLLAGKEREKRSPGSQAMWEGGEITCKTCCQGFPTVNKFEEHLKKFGKVTYWEATEGGDKVMGLRCVSGKKVVRKKGSTKKKQGKGRKTTKIASVQELVSNASSAQVLNTSVPSSQDTQTLSHEHSYQKPYGQESVIESTSSTNVAMFTNSVSPSNVSAAVPVLDNRESMPDNTSQGDISINNCNQNITGLANHADTMLDAERTTAESCEDRLAVLSNSGTNNTATDNTTQGDASTSHELESESVSVENGDRESGGKKKGVRRKKTQAGKGAVCPTCGKKFAYKSSLRTHQFIHSGEKPYPCSVCRKSFRQAGDLQRHLAVHTGERRYTCQVCKKGYKQSGDLAAHMMDHTDDVRFSCPVCSKRLKRKCDLRKHMYTHTGFYPFQCDLCGKQFREKAKMLNHKRNKHGAQKIFVCEVCGKQFTHPGCLKNHQRKHSGNKPHVCGVCSKGYVQRGKLLKHMRTHQQTNTQVPQWGIVEEVVLQEAGGVNLMDQGYEENVMNVFRTIEAAQALTFMPEAVVEIQL